MNKLLFFLGFTTQVVFGQQVTNLSATSSIENNSLQDIDRVDMLNRLSYSYYRISADTMLTYAYQASVLAKRINYRQGMILAYANMGTGYRESNQYELAITYLDSGTMVAKKINHDSLISDILKRKAVTYRFMGDYYRAIETNTTAIKIKRTINDKVGLSHCLSNLGIVYQNLGEYDSAYSYFVQSIDLKTITGDELGLSSTFLNIGKVKFYVRDYEVALNYLQASLEIKKKHHDIRGQAFVYEFLGEVKHKTNDNLSALSMYQKAIDIYRSRNDQKGISSIYSKMGELYVLDAKYELGMAHLIEAVMIKKDIGDKQGLADAYFNLALCMRGLNRPSQSIVYSDSCIGIANAIDYSRGLANATGVKHVVLNSQNRHVEAYQTLVLHNQHFNKLLNTEKLKETVKLETLYRASRLQNENSLLQKERIISQGKLTKQVLELEKQRLISFSLMVTAFLMTILALNWWRYNVKKRKAIDLLRKHSEEIAMQRDKIASQTTELKSAYEEIKEMNMTLEKRIQERTHLLLKKNEKLKEYTYSNSHIVRAPLSRILALVSLFDNDNCDLDEARFISKNVYHSALELDEILREINKVLEEEGVV